MKVASATGVLTLDQLQRGAWEIWQRDRDTTVGARNAITYASKMVEDGVADPGDAFFVIGLNRRWLAAEAQYPQNCDRHVDVSSQFELGLADFQGAYAQMIGDPQAWAALQCAWVCLEWAQFDGPRAPEGLMRSARQWLALAPPRLNGADAGGEPWQLRSYQRTRAELARRLATFHAPSIS